jgi:hypothetical protein
LRISAFTTRVDMPVIFSGVSSSACAVDRAQRRKHAVGMSGRQEKNTTD